MLQINPYVIDILILVTLLSGSCIAQQVDNCKVCLPHNVACLDEQNFAICINGASTNIPVPCPHDRICTAEVAVCLPAAQGFPAVCRIDNCGSCTATDGSKACVDDTHYGFCFGQPEPIPESIRECPKNYVCNIHSPQLCDKEQVSMPTCPVQTTTAPSTTQMTTTLAPTDPIDTSTLTDSTIDSSSSFTPSETTLTTIITPPITTTFMTPTDSSTESTIDTSESTVSTTFTTPITTTPLAPTTDSSTETTATATPPIISSTYASSPDIADTTTTTKKPNTPRDGDALCADMGRTGKFKPDNDTTCRDYIECTLISNQFIGWRFTCIGYFNPAIEDCQAEKPPGC